MINDDNCPPPEALRMGRLRREVEINSVLSELQLRLDLTDVDMVRALLGWADKTLSFNTVRTVDGQRDTRWRRRDATLADSLPETLKVPPPDL